MALGFEEVKDRIRQSIDIVDLVSQHIELRRQGSMFVGLCPWHNDSKPSLQVNPNRQSWKCWVCDIGGDIFNFVMQREGIEFREALKMLAERAGVELAANARPAVPGSVDDKNTLYRAMEWAVREYHQYLLRASEAARARAYLAERGLQAESIERFQLGFAPADWNWLVDRGVRQGFAPDIQAAVGLVTRSERSGRWLDRFRGRVMFPICDLLNRPIALGGRILPELADDKTAKYINSPETRLFSKSEQLYGLNLARDVVARERQVIVMEGYTDVIVAHQTGVTQAVAVLGTALGPRHIPTLRRFADRITLILDGDAAGQRRANEILDLFIAQQMDLRIVTLPDNLDPCDYLLRFGREPLLQAAANAPDAWEHRILVETRGIDLVRDTHRANRALETLLGTLAQIRGDSQLDSAQRLREQQILNRLAREFHLEESDLRQRLVERRGQNAAKTTPSLRPPTAVAKPAEPSATDIAPTLELLERDLFEMLLQYPDTCDIVMEHIDVTQLKSLAAREIFRVIQRCCQAGQVPDFARVMLAFDDSSLKNLLVSLDESGRTKMRADREMWLQDLLRAFSRRTAEDAMRRQQAALEANELDENQQLETLLSILRTKQELLDA